jgi:hypothetical protein
MVSKNEGNKETPYINRCENLKTNFVIYVVAMTASVV